MMTILGIAPKVGCMVRPDLQVSRRPLAYSPQDLELMFDNRGQTLIEVASSDEFPAAARLIKTSYPKSAKWSGASSIAPPREKADRSSR